MLISCSLKRYALGKLDARLAFDSVPFKISFPNASEQESYSSLEFVHFGSCSAARAGTRAYPHLAKGASRYLIILAEGQIALLSLSSVPSRVLVADT